MSRIHTPLRHLGGCLALVLVLGLSANALAQTQYERFAGRIADKAGAPLVGSVSINSTSVSTKDGAFELYVPYAQRYVIQAQARGYVPASVIHTGQSLEQLDLRLAKAEAFTLPPGQPVSVVDSRGTTLSIPANALVDSLGKPATVPLTLSLYTYDLRTEQMVGDMTAIDSTGAQVMLQSIGAFSADFTDAAGKPYNLASGSKATITLRADPANPFTGTLPLWWYDQTKGVWIEEGSATVRDGVASGQVGHFSVWNFDISKTTPSCIRVTLDPLLLHHARHGDGHRSRAVVACAHPHLQQPGSARAHQPAVQCVRDPRDQRRALLHRQHRRALGGNRLPPSPTVSAMAACTSPPRPPPRSRP